MGTSMGRWCRRQYKDIKGNLKFYLLLFLWTPLATAGKNLLQMIGHIPSVYSWCIVFLVSAVMFWWIGRSYKHPISVSSSNQSQGTEKNVAVPTTFQSVDAFYRTYDNALLQECENNLRVQANNYSPGIEREKFLTRLCSSVIVLSVFENLWLQIYRSQILTLETLNKSPRQIDSLCSFYDAAKNASPDVYKAYTFNSWLAFMKANTLIREDGDNMQITVRGKEFLKYLVSTSRSADDRRY